MLVLFSIIVGLESAGGSNNGVGSRHGAVVRWNMTFPSFFFQESCSAKHLSCGSGYTYNRDFPEIQEANLLNVCPRTSNE